MTDQHGMAIAAPVRVELVPIAKAAEEIDRSPWTIRRWAADPASGYPEAINVQNKLYFYRHELDAWYLSRPRVSEVPTTMNAATEPPHLRSSRSRSRQ